MTVEIAFALVTAAMLGAAVFASAFALALAFDLTGAARERMSTGGALLGAAAGVWRVVRVLRRFDVRRRKGH